MEYQGLLFHGLVASKETADEFILRRLPQDRTYPLLDIYLLRCAIGGSTFKPINRSYLKFQGLPTPYTHHKGRAEWNVSE